MKAVNVRQLKSNPSEALREACKPPVIVLNRHGVSSLTEAASIDPAPRTSRLREIVVRSLTGAHTRSCG